MADINEVVVRGSAAGFEQEILAGRHPLTADEPVAASGADTGPTPYDLLLAALGASTLRDCAPSSSTGSMSQVQT